MPANVTIPKRGSADAAPDHQALFAEGLAHVRRLAGGVWTDHNVHDPGITTLELLCYALTDLVYRAAFPVQDLLARADGDEAGLRSQFFTAREILTGAPLTAADYRKLLIDVVDVKNAWLRPVTESYYADTIEGTLLRASPPGTPGVVRVDVRGLHVVLLEYVDDANAERRAAARTAARALLHRRRGLCEDFVRIDEVETQDFALCAELELAPDADVAAVHARILFDVQRYLAPPVLQYRLDEMLARRHADGTRYTVDEIFDGPALEHGFVDDGELTRSELREEIRLSDVIAVVMAVPGVLAVRDAVVNALGTAVSPADRWRLPVERGRKPMLDPRATRLVFYKRDMPFVAPRDDVTARLDELVREGGARDRTPAADDLPIPPGRFRDPESYHSFQNHFPAIYGLGDVGLVGSVGPRRQALAYQMKAYLLFFDQVMADYLAQLAHVRDLFAFRAPDGEAAPGDRTYFHQVVDSFRDWHAIYADAGVGGDTGRAAVRAALDALDDPARLVERRNRFLDHLIARFAERFHDFVHVMRAEFGATGESMIRHKREFLRDYPAISSGRSLGYDHTRRDDEGLWNSLNVSGLELRLARLLGLPNPARRNLGEIAYDVYAEVDATPGDEFRFRVRKRDTGKIVLSGSTHYATPALAREEMRRAIGLASVPTGYERKTTGDGRFYFNVVDADGDVVARRIEYFPTTERMEEAIAELVEYLRAEYNDEGMYVIENVLLRPEQLVDGEVATTRDGMFVFRLRSRDSGHVVMHGSSRYDTEEQAADAMRRATSLTLDATRFVHRQSSDGRHYLELVGDSGAVLAQGTERFETEDALREAIAALGEHAGDPLLPICPDPNCVDCADEDPYSYRVHVILPAYGRRFEDMEFRRFAEQVIREETPAHVQPKVCWVSRDDMAALERLYRDWLYLRSGRESADRRRKLADFIEALYRAKNVYPAQRLRDCDAPEGQDKFLLGRTALGTAP